MAVKNSLQKTQKATIAAYMSQDAVKNKINEVIGGKDGQPRWMPARILGSGQACGVSF